LEARIAPAVIVVNAHTASYTDVDGDQVTIQVSKGDLHTAGFTTAAVGLGDQLELIDLHQGGFEGANLSVTVKKGASGDGAANLGAINATGQNLGTVSVPGDLGQIDVGTNSSTIQALKQLNVHSLGRFGLETQGGTGDLSSDINGSVGVVKVAADVDGARINVFGGSTLKLGTTIVGGSLIGDSNANSGAISSSGAIGQVRIGGDVVGGAGATSGYVQAGARLSSVTVAGSLIGGEGAISGQIGGGTGIGQVKIGHDLVGAVGPLSGSIGTGGKIGSITIGGSVIGGEGPVSGSVGATDDLGSLFVGGNLQGGMGSSSGHIQANAGVGSIRLGGSVIGGDGFVSGQIQLNGETGSLSIGGDVRGNSGGVSGQIQANGFIKSLSIGGSLIGGTGDFSGQIQITQKGGAITIGHDVRGGSGGDSGSLGGMGQAGNLDSLAIGGSVVGGRGNLAGSLFVGDVAKLVIKGNVIGGSITGSSSLDGSGEIVANHLGSVVVGGSIIAGADTSTGSLTHGAGIRAGEDIASLVVMGNLVGNSGASPVVISAQGQANPDVNHDAAIGSLIVGGQVKQALILAGYNSTVDAGNTSAAFANNNAQINSVVVGGDWAASSLVAGTQDANNDGFGNADDTSGGWAARISKVVIGGAISGSAGAGDHFGFDAHRFGTFKVAGAFVPLSTVGATPVELSAITADVTIRQV
jgi:hypothetical protein